MTTKSIKRFNITKVSGGAVADTSDALAIEEPLEIRLEYGQANERQIKNVSVTMRTPGNDAELAAGFLFTERIISSGDAISNIEHSFISCAENKENVVVVKLKEGVVPNLHNSERNFYTSSSCGVCGKGSIDAIRTVSSFVNKKGIPYTIEAEMLFRLPDVLRYYQDAFTSTGGIHASGLFNLQGELMLLREDVGRHNALDKLIGAAINQNWLPLNNHILLLSGRASFELVQKAAMAGITIIAAVGAPSSLAVELAEEFNITLAGFLRNQRFNIYTAAHRILLPANENTY
ncbi:formate dehydrogenase accessory sulfurtransferase FdhD [uncultured Mucilaginibacter sp.]|uniref:formate dehydrogenase accessory sulfurtransferase FdhD n=1 Tax=uncultured Mucilaginibacter sp. TaxID=797541 RepID=UPI0025F785DE|nr:formate dehydrogenase accessory sulfurtransferase FdhD [uncultured Mucilaginibacter sp.]